jgi:RNA polymerase sigma factor FliA
MDTEVTRITQRPMTDANTLVEHHLDLIDQVVDRLAARFPRHVDRDELRGAGAAGLVDAAHRYDPAIGVPFPRYAYVRIRGEVLDETRTRDWVTRRVRRDLRAIDATVAVLELRLQRSPSEAEIGAELGMDAATVRDRLAAAVTSRVLALDRTAGDDQQDAYALADRLEETDVRWLPGLAVEQTELLDMLSTAIAHLPDVLQQVLVEHQFEGRLLREIAEELGVTEARVSQLGNEALHALRAYFGTVCDDVPPVPGGAPGKRRRAAYVAQVTAALGPTTRSSDRPSDRLPHDTLPAPRRVAVTGTGRRQRSDRPRPTRPAGVGRPRSAGTKT